MMTPKTGNREPQQNYRLETVSNELLEGAEASLNMFYGVNRAKFLNSSLLGLVCCNVKSTWKFSRNESRAIYILLIFNHKRDIKLPVYEGNYVGISFKTRRDVPVRLVLISLIAEFYITLSRWNLFTFSYNPYLLSILFSMAKRKR